MILVSTMDFSDMPDIMVWFYSFTAYISFTEVAIMVLNILIISKKYLMMLKGVHENPVIDCKIVDLS